MPSNAFKHDENDAAPGPTSLDAAAAKAKPKAKVQAANNQFKLEMVSSNQPFSM